MKTWGFLIAIEADTQPAKKHLQEVIDQALAKSWYINYHTVDVESLGEIEMLPDPTPTPTLSPDAYKDIQ